MTYLRLDDNFADHPKIAPLSDAAFRLHVLGLTYCARLQTDGYLPLAATPARYRKALPELVRAGLWETRGEACYGIHDYLDWNISRAEIAQRREVGRQAARARWNGNGKAK